MTNAELFKKIFGIYAEEFWAYPKEEMLDWLTSSVEAIRNLPSVQLEQRWISVSDWLPEDEKEVLVTRHFLSDNQLKKNAITESFYVEVASRMDDEWTSYSDEYKIRKHLHKVTAWMPLPEPYKEEKNDG